MSYLNLLQHISKFDNVYTPEIALHEIVKYLPKGSIIWECANSDSKHENQITKYLRSKGYKVIETSIHEGFDFLNDEPNFQYDLILTNPPYSLKDKFLQRCYELGKPFALLLPTYSLGGITRGKMFRRWGIEVLAPDKRFDFTGGGSPHTHTSWFCWCLLSNKENVIEFYKVEE